MALLIASVLGVGDMAYIVMAYIVMAYVVMAYVFMAYVVMAYIVMAYIVIASVLGVGIMLAEPAIGTLQAVGTDVDCWLVGAQHTGMST